MSWPLFKNRLTTGVWQGGTVRACLVPAGRDALRRHAHAQDRGEVVVALQRLRGRSNLAASVGADGGGRDARSIRAEGSA